MKKYINYFLLVIFSVGCSGGFESSEHTPGGSTGDSVMPGGSASPGLPSVSYKAHTLGVVSQRQYLPKVLNCLGLDKKHITATDLSAIKVNITSLSEEGDIASVKAPMMMAKLTLSSLICSSLVKQETAGAEAKYFKGFAFDKAKAAYDLEQTATLIHNSCLGRDIHSDELSLIKDKLREGINESESKSVEEALFVCIAILSSGLSILN